MHARIAMSLAYRYTRSFSCHRINILPRNLKTLFLVLIALCTVPHSTWAREWRFDDVDRVVAITDIHGAYDAMVETLQNVAVLGDDLSWAGGQTQLVIVGDTLDRGPKSRAAMDLLMRLEGEAEAAGGRVHVLIGNHESMILTGDMRYVSDAEYRAFAGEADARERARWFDLYVERRGHYADELRDEFKKAYPWGYFAMRRAFRVDGHYGQWLLQKNIIVVINGTAFVHGGLPPVAAQIGLQGINGNLQKELVDYVEILGALTDAEVLLPTDSHYNYEAILNGYLPALDEDPEVLQAIEAGKRLVNAGLVSTDGPLWYRNNIMCPRIVEEHRMDAALAAIGADRVVVGHTPTPGRKVLQRFGGKLIEIDTGMLNFYYNGIGHALVLAGDSVSVTNQLGVDSLVPLEQQRKVGRRPGNMTAKDLAVLLERGEIVTVKKEDSPRRTMVKVSNGEYTIDAIFNKPKGRGFYPGVAAYRLDQLLQLDMVPVTVIREVDGSSGSLQFLPGNSIDEAERSAEGKGGGAWCSITEQWPAMYVFDVLVYNEGRSQHRMLYDKSSWRLILSEHDRSFSTRKGRPAHLKNAPILVSPGWQNALAELSDEVLQESFSDVLDKRRIRALQARRDELLASE
jgi:Calcineurin-like phosphoesterase